MGATTSMLGELAHRRRWMEEFGEHVRRRARDCGSDPNHRPAWPDARTLYEDGYHPYQAATKYLQRHHLGEGS